MKIATSFFTALLVTGAVLWAQAAAQGLLPALVAAAVDRGLGLRARHRN